MESFTVRRAVWSAGMLAILVLLFGCEPPKPGKPEPSKKVDDKDKASIPAKETAKPTAEAEKSVEAKTELGYKPDGRPEAKEAKIELKNGRRDERIAKVSRFDEEGKDLMVNGEPVGEPPTPVKMEEPKQEKKSGEGDKSAKGDSDDDDATPPKPRDLGPPLAEDPNALKQLGKYQAWLDPKQRQVLLVGETCKADYPLEFLVTTRSRAYESVLVIEGDRRPPPGELSVFQQIHTALILLGAKPGIPSVYDEKKGEMIPATGTEVSIDLRWKDKEGKIQKASAKDWIRDIKTGKPLSEGFVDPETKKVRQIDWVFAGSRLVKDQDGQSHYLADGGDFICVLNNPTAMLDLPIESAGAIESRSFKAFSDRLPPPGTPVTIILTPKVEKPAKPATGATGEDSKK